MVIDGSRRWMKLLKDFEKGEKLIPEVVVEKCRRLGDIANRPEMTVDD
jgi:hypothetical protein